MSAPHSMDLRERAVAAVEAGWSPGVVAEIFGIGRATLTRWRARKARQGDVVPDPVGGWRHGLTEEDVAVVGRLVAEHPDHTLPELVEDFEAATGKKTSHTAISRALKKLGITRKKKRTHATERDTPRVRKLRRTFRARQKKLDVRRLVFVDETGTTLDMTRTHARAPAGQEVVEAIPRNRGTVTTFIGALTSEGLDAPFTIDGATTGDVFVAYVGEVLVPVLHPGDLVVMDQVGAHKDARVRPLLEKAGASVLLLPPYSPEFNPIEEVFALVKGFLRTARARTREALDLAIAFITDLVGPREACAYFRHAGYACSS